MGGEIKYCIIWAFDETVKKWFRDLCKKHKRDFLMVKSAMAERFYQGIVDPADENEMSEYTFSPDSDIGIFEVKNGEIGSRLEGTKGNFKIKNGKIVSIPE